MFFDRKSEATYAKVNSDKSSLKTMQNATGNHQQNNGNRNDRFFRMVSCRLFIIIDINHCRKLCVTHATVNENALETL
jgi:hypothetical protein